MKHLIATAFAATALLVAPVWAQDTEDEEYDEEEVEEEEVEEEAEAPASKSEKSIKEWAEMGPGVYKIKLDENNTIQSCTIVGQARISMALGKSKGIMNAKKRAKQSAEAELIRFLKAHVSHVSESGEQTQLQITGVDEEGNPIETGTSTETQSEFTTTQAQGQLRGMMLIGFDQDKETETLTQVYGWKPAFAAAAAGAAGAMNTEDAAPGKAAPTGIDGDSSGSGSGKGKGKGSGKGKGKKPQIKSKTRAVEGAEEFL